jgi:sugar phosphate isomerase/epimerase
MNVKFFCPRWGCESASWDGFLLNVKQAGYDGVEYGISNETTPEELSDVMEKIHQHGLEVIPQHYGTYDADFSRHFDRYSAWLELVKPFPAIKIDSQTGKDFFTFDQNKQLIDVAVKHTLDCGVEVYHETHRNKFPFAAHIAREYLEKLPYLKITLDASHWVNVAESYLEDQPEAMAIAIHRTEHIHARVGYPEGPQVPDPRAPEWQEALAVHIAWWDRVLARKKEEDPGAVVTITPEFGPFPYMVHLPYSGKAITDQWAVNTYMKDLLKERYQDF